MSCVSSSPPSATPRSPEAKTLEAPPQPVIDAFHPRQRIFTDPVHPTHPRQTLISPKAPAIAPKLVANLPNIVQFEQAAGPAKPRLQISEDMLQKSHPKEKRLATSTAAPPTDIPNMEQHVADTNLPTAQNGPARPDRFRLWKDWGFACTANAGRRNDCSTGSRVYKNAA